MASSDISDPKRLQRLRFWFRPGMRRRYRSRLSLAINSPAEQWFMCELSMARDAAALVR
jgi:hypothetical protein